MMGSAFLGTLQALFSRACVELHDPALDDELSAIDLDLKEQEKGNGSGLHNANACSGIDSRDLH